MPVIFGVDYSGIVSAVGESVTEFSPGDAVYGIALAHSAAAEYMLLSAAYKYSINKIPGNLSFEESASLPASASTALSALFRIDREIPGGLRGRTVLIPAGLGGIGSIALQLLKPVFKAGKVITTLSSAKIPLLSNLLGEGLVDQIIDYTEEDVLKQIGQGTVDFMFDTTFQSMAFLSLLKPGSGVVLSVYGKSGDTMAKDWPLTPWILIKIMNAVDAMFKWRARRWGVRYEHAFSQMSGENAEAIDLWVREGKLKPIVGGIIEWDDLESVRKIGHMVGSAKGAVGKYVLRIS